MWAVIYTNLLFFKQRWVIFVMMLGMSLGLTAIFGMSLGQEYKPVIFYTTSENVEYSESFIKAFTSIDKYAFTYLATTDDVQTKIKKNQGVAGIVIDTSLIEIIQEGKGTLWVMKGTESVEYKVLLQDLRNILNNMHQSYRLSHSIDNVLNEKGIETSNIGIETLVLTKMQEAGEKPTFSIIKEQIGGKGYNQVIQNLLGFSLMFSMYIVVFGIGKIISEKNEYIWQRQLTSPLTMSKILLGNGGTTVFFGLIQIVLMVFGGKYLLGVDWGGNNLLILLILFSFICAVMSIGLLFTTFLNTENQLGALAPVFITATSMLGGCMWPMEMVQIKIIRYLAYLTPQYWAMESLTQVVNYKSGFMAVLPSLSVLWGIGIGFFFIGSFVLSKRRV